MAGKSFGSATAAPSSPTSSTPTSSTAPLTSEQLVDISRREGAGAAVQAVLDRQRINGRPAEIAFVEHEGEVFVVNAADRKVIDRRTQKQRDADDTMRWETQRAQRERDAAAEQTIADYLAGKDKPE